jgi:5'-3' exonuclease
MGALCLLLCLIALFLSAGAFRFPASSLSTLVQPRPLHPSPVSRSTALHGIPKLFRWLVDLYPLIVESVGDVIGERSMSVDYFYLDMNGIIHSCTHANADKLIASNENDMFERIFAYTDRLYKLVKPRKMMFLAVDGVAPRAKMNQQRARRFRASKEREALIAEHIAREGKLPESESFDSNCITPGTAFMHRLGIAFRAWIDHKMETDAFWQQGATVVFSGPDVPGEGEHKVMDMIRSLQKDQPDYKVGKFRHCMYGLDADLIMLSLVTHEPFFILLREKISRRKKDALSYVPEDFELLEISVLRTMLKQHFRQLNQRMNELTKKKLINTEEDYQRNGRMDAAEVRRHMAMNIDNHEDNTISINVVDKSQSEKSIKSTDVDLERVIDDFVFM